jgi:hypothetical protein
MISIERNNRTAWMTDDGTLMGDGTLQTYLRTSMKSLSRSSGDPHVALARKLEQDRLVNVVAVRALSDAPKFIMGTAKLKMFTQRLRSITLKHGKHDQSSHGRRGGGGGGGGLAPATPKGEQSHASPDMKPMVNDGPIKPGRSPEAVALATQYRDRYVAAEPRITADMQEIARASGMGFVNSEYRIKGTDSLARKIDDESQKQGKPREQIAADMSDVIRFTMEAPTETYAKSAADTLQRMQDAGYELNVKNYWVPGDPYQGLNVAMTSPTGERIEMQFHTPESHRVKDPVHEIYGVYREEKNVERQREMYDQMASMSSVIPIPPGVLDIPATKFVPRP